MQTTSPSPALVPPPAPRAPQPAQRPVLDPLRHFDDVIESRIGGDLRLIYGMAAPILVVVGLIAVLVLSPSYWLVGAVLVIELACLMFMVVKLMAMLGQPEAEEGRPQEPPTFTSL